MKGFKLFLFGFLALFLTVLYVPPVQATSDPPDVPVYGNHFDASPADAIMFMETSLTDDILIRSNPLPDPVLLYEMPEIPGYVGTTTAFTTDANVFTPENPDKVPLQNTHLTVLRLTEDGYQEHTPPELIPVADITIPDPNAIIGGIKDSKSWADLLGVEAMVYTLLITIGGWLSGFIPFFRSIDSGTFRVLTWAILVIGGGVAIGFGNVWVGAISYFFSTSLYDIVLKWFIKSPKPKPQ